MRFQYRIMIDVYVYDCDGVAHSLRKSNSRALLINWTHFTNELFTSNEWYEKGFFTIHFAAHFITLLRCQSAAREEKKNTRTAAVDELPHILRRWAKQKSHFFSCNRRINAEFYCFKMKRTLNDSIQSDLIYRTMKFMRNVRVKDRLRLTFQARVFVGQKNLFWEIKPKEYKCDRRSCFPPLPNSYQRINELCYMQQ